MATFAPQVQPTNDPNYLGWSRAISQPEGDKSSAYLMEGLGNTLESGAKVADFVVKDAIKEGLRNDLTPLADEFTQQLRGAYEQARGQGASMDAAARAPANVPDDLKKNLPSTLGMLDAAKANGRFSETDYIAKRDMVLKDYRSRFPGYKDYIDSEQEKVSGMPAANTQIKGLLSDLNSYAQNANSIQNHVINELSSAGNLFPGSAALVKNIREGRQTIYDGLQFLEQRKGMENWWKLNDISEGQDKKEAAQVVTQGLSNIAASHIDSLISTSGTTFDKLFEQANGPKGLSDDQWAQWGTAFQANALQAERAMRAAMNAPTINKDTGLPGKSRAQILGTAATEEAIKSAMAMHTKMIEGTTNKISGLAFGAHRWAEGVLSSGSATIMGVPDARAAAITLHFAQMAGGPNGLNSAILKSVQSTLGPKMAAVYTKDFIEMLGQVNAGQKGTTSGPAPVTIPTIMDRSLNGGVKPEQKDYWESIARMPQDIIMNPQIKDPGKINALRGTFTDPKSILKWQKEVVDQNGNNVPGQFTVLTNWTTPGMTKEILRIANDNDPKLFAQYKDWTEKTFNVLYGPEIADLDKLSSTQNVGIKWVDEKGYPPRFEAYALRGANVDKSDTHGQFADTRDPRIVTQQVQTSLDRLNHGLANLHEMYKVTGQDVSAYLIKSLVQQGAKMDRISDTKGQMLKAISTSKMNFAEEGDKKTGDLQQFLRNPTREAPKPSQRPSRSNLSSEELLGIKVDDIPEGVSAKDFIKQLQNKRSGLQGMQQVADADVVRLHAPGTFAKNTQLGDVLNGVAQTLGVPPPKNIIPLPKVGPKGG